VGDDDVVAMLRFLVCNVDDDDVEGMTFCLIWVDANGENALAGALRSNANKIGVTFMIMMRKGHNNLVY